MLAGKGPYIALRDHYLATSRPFDEPRPGTKPGYVGNALSHLRCLQVMGAGGGGRGLQFWASAQNSHARPVRASPIGK